MLVVNHTFHLQPSHQLRYLVLFFYSLAYIVLFYLSLPWVIKSFAILLHSIHGYLTWQYQVKWAHADAIIKFWYIERKWYVCTQAGDECGAQLQANTVCMYYLTVLHFKLIPSNRRKTIIILKDSLADLEFIRLRRLLWWEL